MDAFAFLQARGFVQQCSHPDEVREALARGPVTFYIGFDPTASSLHVGHFVQVMVMAHLARMGHRAIALVGGGTARVGDPTGKTELRQMLSDDDIRRNSEAIRRQLERFLPSGVTLADNAEWLMELRYIPFLRDIGRHFSVNRMLTAEAYRIRLERGLSFIEFNYQILQAYDFLELFRRHGCRLQVGGDDQWGNIVAGVDLVRRLEQTQVWAITTPLVLTATGEKMGKTAAGALWLDPERTPPFDFWQYWYNCDDRDVGRFLRLLTFLDDAEIARLEGLRGADIREAKRVLANEVTGLVHGREAAEQAERAARAMVGAVAAEDLPTVALSQPTRLCVALVTAGLAASNSEARRLVAGGGVTLDGAKVADPEQVLDPGALGAGRVVRVGKKRAARLVAGG